jgi:uncharacterized protein (DUF488 family)
MTIYTIGTSGRHDDDFIAVLKQHQIDAVIDIRLRNEGRYYKFASGKHIKVLCEAQGIAYRHDTRFSPTAEMLDRYKADKDWPLYVRAYQALIEERDMAGIWQEVASGYLRPCLLCAEKSAEQCHRRLLGEALVGGDTVELRHL